VFEDLSATDLLFILAALALGFGVVRFMIVTSFAGEKAAPTPQRAKVSAEPGPASNKDEVSESQGVQNMPERPTVGSPTALWHEILGVQAWASPEQIRDAYEEKLAQYDPRRVDGLGPDLVAIARQRSNEIELAYQRSKAGAGAGNAA